MTKEQLDEAFLKSKSGDYWKKKLSKYNEKAEFHFEKSVPDFFMFLDKGLNEIYDNMLSHKNNETIMGVLSEDSKTMFINAHGSSDGRVATGKQGRMTLEQLGAYLSENNLIPEGVENIYTMSCYGGLQKPFTLPNGITIQSGHNSTKQVHGLITHKNIEHTSIAAFTLQDDATVIPELANYIENNDAVNTLVFDTKTFNEGKKLTAQEAFDKYGPDDDRFYTSQGLDPVEQKEKINKINQEHKTIEQEKIDLENDHSLYNEMDEYIEKEKKEILNNKINHEQEEIHELEKTKPEEQIDEISKEINEEAKNNVETNTKTSKPTNKPKKENKLERKTLNNSSKEAIETTVEKSTKETAEKATEKTIKEEAKGFLSKNKGKLGIAAGVGLLLWAGHDKKEKNNNQQVAANISSYGYGKGAPNIAIPIDYY